MRSGRIVTALAVLAVAMQCYGLYRVTGPPAPSWFPNADKVEHTVGFAGPVLLVLLALRWRRGRASGARSSTGWLVAGLFVVQAVLSEILQHLFYRRRTGDPYDVLADVIGIGLGVLGFLLVRRVLLGAPVHA